VAVDGILPAKLGGAGVSSACFSFLLRLAGETPALPGSSWKERT